MAADSRLTLKIQRYRTLRVGEGKTTPAKFISSGVMHYRLKISRVIRACLKLEQCVPVVGQAAISRKGPDREGD